MDLNYLRNGSDTLGYDTGRADYAYNHTYRQTPQYQNHRKFAPPLHNLKGFDDRSKPRGLDAVKLNRCPDYLIAKPLQDFDASENYDTPSTETFIILSRRGKSGQDQAHRFTTTRCLYMMGPLNPVRLFATRILVHQYFEAFVIFIILVNCVFLALDHPPEEAEYVFAFIYTSEMFLKIIAKGFVMHSFAYLRDAWNALDFFVVIMGYVTLAPNIANFSGIRTIRVLRALRTISAMKAGP